jgi:hypothetical protein
LNSGLAGQALYHLSHAPIPDYKYYRSKQKKNYLYLENLELKCSISKLGMVVHNCNLSIQEAEAERSQVQNPAPKSSTSGYQQITCSFTSGPK